MERIQRGERDRPVEWEGLRQQKGLTAEEGGTLKGRRIKNHVHTGIGGKVSRQVSCKPIERGVDKGIIEKGKGNGKMEPTRRLRVGFGVLAGICHPEFKGVKKCQPHGCGFF